MTRCPYCNGIMKNTETACYSCGEQNGQRVVASTPARVNVTVPAARPELAEASSTRGGFAALASAAFFGSLALTIALMFLSD